VTRETHLVELVDPSGVPVGSTTVSDAHSAPGQLHRAFSVLLVDDAGRVLLQRRAESKTRFALRWANSCCGHPLPGQRVVEAASKRLIEELGISPIPLNQLGVHVYQAADPSSGLVEREYDHVLVGRYSAEQPLDPDPAEVESVEWVSPTKLADAMSTDPSRYAPWLLGVLQVAHL
jgi:isopentenyl-diphosphate delta-isomerase